MREAVALAWVPGMPSLIEISSLDTLASTCQALELSFIELNLDDPTWCPERLAAGLLRDVSAANGIFFTAHLPETLDLASIHPTIARGSLERAKELVQWAGEAGMKKVNMHLHSGVYFTLPERKVWIYQAHQAEFIERLTAAFAALYQHAIDCGVAVCIENAINFHRPFVEAGIEALSWFEGFALTWDIGHDTMSGLAERPVLERHRDKIAHMHLHDCADGRDHQVLFSGDADIKGALTFADERDLTVVIEVKTMAALRESAARLEL